MPARTVQNPSALIGNVPVLDGNSVTFPAWRTRLEDLLAIQGVHDIVTGKLSRPETDYKDAKPVAQGSQRVYFAEESGTDWDSLSEVARATMKMTLSVDLAIRYKDLKPASLLFKTICDAYEKNTRARRMMLEDSFWCARHDPNQPIAKWIAKIRNAASDLKSVKLTPADQQICDRLLRGLDDTWKPIRDHLVYSPNEISLDDAIGALEAHEVSMQVTFDHSGENYAAAAVTKPKKRLGCWNCGQTGHHSSACPNPSLKNKSNATAKSAVARAGATSAAPLGNCGPSDDEDDDSFDKEIDVVWG
ncbi:uncharacterized protein PGTG_07800 [Puccinia graminis f. sp. tritici CRL 75-36-700-3]|uniref:CCHC-type domain-containing protein n=1 Tax=Puccinia graminis f. sp. tritici (strain CRL 75-36-700-3 / race SCCL) TaxID=418459 RepID=E3KB08_PUCGT|nr:uncharacterized protein PGTG_07800 [Puccinia graminis f. sp. tritici CRL 75-36-700-3]EFP81551.2 hypothetical protein PGTG_07800 [Puccinia graminis f. sp. tritici CRL 75-36-700-3]